MYHLCVCVCVLLFSDFAPSHFYWSKPPQGTLKFCLIYDILLFHFLRQNKDLKSRVTHLEGSQRTNQDSLVSKLNSRIQELEERLQGEEK